MYIAVTDVSDRIIHSILLSDRIRLPSLRYMTLFGLFSITFKSRTNIIVGIGSVVVVGIAVVVAMAERRPRGFKPYPY